MSRILKYWFVFSVWVIVAFAGWWLTIAGYQRSAFLLSIAVAVDIFVFLGQRRSMSARLLLVVGLFLSPLEFGSAAATKNLFHVNDWMKGSATYLMASVQPVRFARESEVIAMSGEDKEKWRQRKLSFLHIFNVDVPRILVSFPEAGLAWLEGKRVTFLNGKSTILLAALPDESILYLDGRFKDHEPQTLVRAKLLDDGLLPIWERSVPDLPMHHWGDVFDGKLYQPGRNLMATASGAPAIRFGNCDRIGGYDVINIFDVETGDHLKTIPLLPSIETLHSPDEDAIRENIYCPNPLHLNAIEIIKNPKHAGYFPNGKVGDLLVSMRNIDTIALLDADTFEVKWSVAKKFVAQHDPTVTDRGTILVFDNKGSDDANGNSRIVEIDIATRRIVGKFEAIGKDFFSSPIRGKITILGEQKYLIQEQGTELTPTEADRPPIDATMFVLECPGTHISNACKKSYVFKADAPHFIYENALVIPRT